MKSKNQEVAMSHECFAAEVERACSRIEKQGPLRYESKRARRAVPALANPLAKRVDWGKKLVSAVKRFDVAAAQEALNGGARVSMRDNGALLVEVACHACSRRSDGEKVFAMISWLHGKGLPVKDGARLADVEGFEQARSAGGEALKAQRKDWAESWIEAWGNKTEPEREALMSLLNAWSRDPDPAARADPMALLDKMFKDVAEDSYGMRLDLVALLGDRLGVAPTEEQWRSVGELIEARSWYSDPGELALVLRQEGPKLDEKTSGLLLAEALSHDSLALMGAVASRAKSLDWMLPDAVWGLMGRVGERLRSLDGKPLEISALHFALWSNPRSRAGSVVKGRECFRALCEIEGAVEGALDNPLPAALADCGLEELEEIGSRWPGLLVDTRGWNVAHEKALNEGELVLDEFKTMLKTSWGRNLVLGKTVAGTTAADVLAQKLGQGQRGERWRVFFEGWEKTQMAAEMKRPRRAKKAKSL